ncbi:hypothetical protein J7T55_001780 [Diaporthe amygdali]|uniref:uncharacterized protein n=1 Tax=Phomopsis amygdali TaxID=1214568 RepID=UPI0022FE4D82|nr:uncharacterized protein J7T55_001780 [Diaporthe amygdali]KAJ0117582.1 hypothetical protein J7T55_001780 [Diaporthe amygdali]
MAQGLDELVEWLVGEVSFYGDGCPLSELIAAVIRFQENDYDKPKHTPGDNGDQEPGEKPTRAPPTEAQLKLVRLAWKWLLGTGEVSIGPEGEWNRLTFDEIMSIPEDAGGQAVSLPEDEKSKVVVTSATLKHKKLPKVRPRIFVGEETIWKTLTGHSIDYKRVPNLEWKCLVVIGSTKEDGILQGDLNRATGQDKRSVPKRTDFLTQKGYIAKRTHMVRGMKTSKLWLTKFAPALPVPSNPLGGKDLSRVSLTRDMQPVAWHQQWTGKDKEGRPEIHYMALGQTIIAITKAWGTLRIRDLKAKLGILGKKWQMKVMSRFLRRFHKLGNVTYVAATFAGDKHVFKDCVRFARDPTESDWRLLLATGKKTSRYTNQGKDKQPRAKSKAKGSKGRGKKAANPAKPAVKILRKKPKLRLGATMTGWVPEKPLANTVADFVLTGGARGYSTPEISTDTVGYVFRRHMFTHLINLSNGEVQPPGLREYQMSKELVKAGNTKQYMFSIAGGRKVKTSDETDEKFIIDPALRQNDSNTDPASQNIEDAFQFGSIDPKVFAQEGSSSLTQLSRMEPGKQTKPRRSYGGRRSKVHVAVEGAQITEAAENADEEQLEGEHGDKTNAIAPPPRARRGRPPKAKVQANSHEAEEPPASRPSRKRKASQRASYLENLNLEDENSEIVDDVSAVEGRPKRRAAMKENLSREDENDEPDDEPEDEQEDESAEEQDRSKPGVYIGIPGSLNPDPHRKGRPRKSIVIIFRSDKLKEPGYLPGWMDYPKPPPASHQSEVSRAPWKSPTRPPLSVDFVPAGPSQAISSKKVVDQTPSTAIDPTDPTEPAVTISQQQKLTQEATEDGEGTIVVQSLGVSAQSQEAEESQEGQQESSNDLAVYSASSAPLEPLSAARAPTKTERQPRKPKLDKYVCEQCGGTWKNDIGLKYHLEKAKVPCNPFYAEHPELMVKAKPVRASRATFGTPEPRDEAASPGSSGQSSVGASPSPRTPRSVRIPRKKKPLAPKFVDQNDPANHRTVLKQRSALRNSQFGASGVSAPRGLKGSEAAAKDAANTTQTATEEEITVTAEPSATEIVVNDHTALNNPEEAEPDEDLPYLAHIRAEKPKQQPEHSVSHLPELGPESRAWQHHTEAAQEYSEVQAVEQDSSLLPTSMNQAYSESSAAMNDVPVSYEPYPLGLLEQTTQEATSGRMDFTAESHGAVLSSSTQSVTRSRRPLPVQRPAVPAETDVMPLQRDEQQAGVFQNQIPPFRLSPTDFKARTAKEVRSHKIEEIIRYLLANNGGVFPSGRALFYAILKIYIKEWPDLPLPTTVGVTRVVNRLQEQQEIKEMSSAYKSPTERLWTTLVMLTLNHIDPNGLVAGDLKKKMKAAQPDVYIPPAFAPDESEKAHFKKLDILPAERGKGPGRRDHKLEEEIVTFDAPFYLQKGLAGVRPRNRPRAIQSEDEDSNAGDGDSEAAETAPPPRRRGRKRAAEGPSPETTPVKKSRRGRKPRNMVSFDAAGDNGYPPPGSIMPHKYSIDESQATNPGLGSLPPSFFSGTASAPTSSYTAPSKVQFLEPNTRLEEEDEPELEAESNDATPENDAAHEHEGYFLHAAGEGSFTSTIELESAGKGVWPSIPNQWFEANDGSFTMKGWFPQARELLKEHLPKSMEQMAYKITSHCKTDKWADPAYGQFVTSVDGCMSWELSDQGHRSMSGTIAPDYVFICFTSSPAVSNMAPCIPEWRDSNNWTLDSIPYERLVGDEEEAAKSSETAEPYGITPNTERGVRRGPGRPRKYPPSVREGPPRKYVRKQPKDESIRELKLQRELTAYPREPGEYFRQKGQEDPEVDWKAEDTRIAAYVAVSTLLGGINKAMDWGIMMRIFPDSKLSNLRKFWATIKKEREGFIQNLTAKFQEDFLEAYENGDLPAIDFNKALEYDWLRLVKWTLALVVREGIDLPPNMPQFDEELELVPVERGEFDWRDSYYHWQRSVFNKFQDAAAEPASTVLDKQEKMEDADSTIARSWVRALCCTDSDKYTPLSIKKKFLTLARGGQRSEQEISDLLEQTIRDLEHRRIAIKQKSQALATGRPYKLNEHFLRTLDRFSNEDKFSVAAGFKIKMDEAFRKGKAVEIPWRTEDGMVIAAFNLQAYGRVRIEPIKKLNVPFGFKPGFYESRKFPKSYYRFDLQVTPTSRYMYNEEIEILWKATDDSVIPGGGEDGILPMWCDFFGKPDRLRWFKMLSAVLFVLGCRGAMTDEFAAQALRPCIEIFEVEMIRKWALEMGIVREITEGCSAVSVSEWWWLICGLPVTQANNPKADAHDQYSGWHKRRWRGQYRVH